MGCTINLDTGGNLTGIPAGGTTGQILVKQSDGCWDVAWEDNHDDLLIKTAGENINGDRVVVQQGSDVFLFDPTNQNHYGKVLGISKNAVLTGENVKILYHDRITVGTILTPGAIYYGGTNGVLTTTPPTTGILQRIGIACSTSELFVDIYIPINKC